MATVTARPVGRGRKHKDRDQGPGVSVFIPPPITIVQKNESLDRRIRNIEALGDGVFLGNVWASYMALPGLVGFWPMNSVQRSTGNAWDMSGQTRTLTYTGNPAYAYFNGLVAYIDLDGTGDYLTRADETDMDIQGDEFAFSSGASGLTIGGWFWIRDTAGTPSLLGKHDNASAAGSAYLLYISSNAANFLVYSGTTASDAASATLSIETWYFIAGRYTPSSEVAVFVNNTKSSDTASIPATINNVAAAFQIGARAGGNPLNARAALCFLCANSLGDDLISSLFSSSRILFGV